MIKAEIVSKISDKLGLESVEVQAVVDSFMEEIKTALNEGHTVYLRGFGSFQVKSRKEKKARNISKNTTVYIPAHNVPTFKPSRLLLGAIRDNSNLPLKFKDTK